MNFPFTLSITSNTEGTTMSTSLTPNLLQWQAFRLMTLVRCTITTLLFTALLILSPSRSQAQCPSGWVSASTTISMTLSCGPATVKVDFCYPGPLIFPKEQYRIVGITVLSPGPGAGCTIDGSVLRSIGKQLVLLNPSGIQCPSNCPRLRGMFQVSYGACMTEISPGIFETCPLASAEGCLDQWAVCCHCNGAINVFYQGSISSDQCEYEWGCITTCAAPDPIEPINCID